jgi:serine/threonine-protein kinase
MLRLANLMEAEIGEWPESMRRTPEADLDRALSLYHRGLQAYFTDSPAAAVTHMRAAEQRLLALDARRPNDPLTLYALAWTGYVGFGAASGAASEAAAGEHFLDLAIQTSSRLLQIEANDNALKAFAANLRQSRAQALSAKGRHREAISMQREVIALFEAALGGDRKANNLNRLIAAHYTMGNIARAAGDRVLACQSYRDARAGISELDRRHALIGFVGNHREAIDGNIALCGHNAPLRRMAVMS